MRETETAPVENGQVIQLPPLILHPFSSTAEVEKLSEILGEDEPALGFLRDRYREIRMLCFIGKDLNRWIAHSLEFLGQCQEPFAAEITEAHLIQLLLIDTPVVVSSKLKVWGVQNFTSVFSRALGLSHVFCHAPEPQCLSLVFIEHFREYADALYRLRVASLPDTAASPRLDFDLYASREYITVFEKDWGSSPSHSGLPSDM